jgi:hypothetical protein
MFRCEKGLPPITFYFYKTDHFVSQKLVFFHKSLVYNFKSLINLFFKNNSQLSKEYVIYFFNREHCHLQSQNGTNVSRPPHHILSNHRPLSSHAAAAPLGINSSSHSWQPFSHPHTHCFISQLELAVSSTGILERIKNFTIPKSFI